jgi:hypothetical protein
LALPDPPAVPVLPERKAQPEIPASKAARRLALRVHPDLLVKQALKV